MPYKIAGIDMHKKVLMVVVIDATLPEEKPERRGFATLPSEMRRLSIWLRERGVEEAMMESTAQYFRSVWLELEPYVLCCLRRYGSARCAGANRSVKCDEISQHKRRRKSAMQCN